MIFKNITSTCILAALIAFSFPVVAHAEFTPFTTSPEKTDKPSYGCEKRAGALACRWGGECVAVGNQCYSCGDKLSWDNILNTCYSCPEGTSLQSDSSGRRICK
jgi:hypothetical protein